MINVRTPNAFTSWEVAIVFRERKSLILLYCLPFCLAAVLLLSQFSAWGQGGKGKPGKPDDGRAADRAAIAQGTASFIKAFESGNARAVAAHWTEEGEFINEDGSIIQGRDELERVYGEFFKKNPKLSIDIDMETLRFTSRNTAIEEGYMKVHKIKPEETSSSRYSVLHVREDGKWLMAVVRDWPSEGVSLRDLDWLIGDWSAKRDDAEIHTSYQWDLNRNYIRSEFTIKSKIRNVSGFEVIGRDPQTGVLRSWVFESDGGFGGATWSRDGKKWMQEASAILPDGMTMAATNVITPIDRDSFTWQSIHRIIADEEVADTAPIKITRVKTKS